MEREVEKHRQQYTPPTDTNSTTETGGDPQQTQLMEREVEQDSNIHHQLTYSATETGGDPQQTQLMEREVEQDSNNTPPTDLQHYRDT